MSNDGPRAPVPTLRDPRASADDIRLTEEAGKVGNLLGIEVLDHVIIGREGSVSLRREGCYSPPR